MSFVFFFSSRRRHTRCSRDWSSDVCSSDLGPPREELKPPKPTWWKRKATIAAAACVVIAGTLYPWIKPKIERLLRLYYLQRLTVVPLTALPGNAWSPTFSPDGSQIAFAWKDRKSVV